jgi:hypothetical protein
MPHDFADRAGKESRYSLSRENSVIQRFDNPAPPLGLGDKWWSGSQRPTSAVSLQRLANVTVIRAAKRRDREGSQIDQRRCGVEWLTKG